jgi:hypothetical protein
MLLLKWFCFWIQYPYTLSTVIRFIYIYNCCIIDPFILKGPILSLQQHILKSLLSDINIVSQTFTSKYFVYLFFQTFSFKYMFLQLNFFFCSYEHPIIFLLLSFFFNAFVIIPIISTNIKY